MITFQAQERKTRWSSLLLIEGIFYIGLLKRFGYGSSSDSGFGSGSGSDSSSDSGFDVSFDLCSGSTFG